MFRWFLLLLALACLYWAYQHGLQRGDVPSSQRSTASEPAPTLAPGPRPGGGLNPFVSDTDIDAPPQRPKVP
jgi:hypothetical protein